MFLCFVVLNKDSSKSGCKKTTKIIIQNNIKKLVLKRAKRQVFQVEHTSFYNFILFSVIPVQN